MSGGQFSSVADCIARLDGADYLIDPEAATVTYLATRMEKPLLVEGPAGVGKTELARALSRALDRELVRLQCYEGLDEAKALYEWEYAKQLLYTQILRDKIGEAVGDAATLAEAVERIALQDDVFFSDRFLLPRPLLKAILSEKPVVLLIDEIDKGDAEFEAFLLEMLGDYQVTVPELGTLTARTRPVTVLTSNAQRELSDALRRRCLHLHLDFPGAERERDIIRRRVPEASAELARQVAHAMAKLRTLGLRKLPSISESIDWARALVLLNAETLEPAVISETLSLVLKYEGDVRKGRESLHALLN
ncbi:MAG TPA: MoxR family ATPase [Candidatus Dormibacteraeota bacterium]|nr:MoxR family ATPase [Candidatus Dormibacteraeota bacterium]